MIVSEYVEFIYFDDCSTDKIETFCNNIAIKNPTHVFLTGLWEPYGYCSNCKIIDEYMCSRGIPTTWVVGDWSKLSKRWLQLKSQVVFIDWPLLRCYNEVVVKHKSDINTVWNPDAGRYLFLTGKPAKINRIGLLYKLHQHNLLQQCDHSLFMHQGMWQQSKEIIPELSDVEFAEFVNRYQQSPDNIIPNMQTDNMHYGGIPYDCGIYATSLFRLVSETNMEFSPPTLTEKTWLTILNRQPFVIAGDRNVCQYLRQLGFETFDTMFEIPTYDNIHNPAERLDSTVEHVKQWLNGNFDKIKVKNMIDHNYHQLESIALNTKDNFKKITGYDIDSVISTDDTLAGF